MEKVRLLKENEQVSFATKVISVNNHRIAFNLNIDYLVELIYTRIAFKDCIVISNYYAFDNFLSKFDEEINDIIDTTIRRYLIALTVLKLDRCKSISKAVNELNATNNLELIIYSMMIDDITDKVFTLYENNK